jgi:RHS repeat-associated protein
MRNILAFLLCILVSVEAGAASSSLPNTDKQPVGFTGYIKDSESGLYYARARYYDPSIGRFMTEDPEAGRDLQPPSLHRYLYAYANPTVYADPTGRDSYCYMFHTGCGLAPETPELHRDQAVSMAGITGIVVAAPLVLQASAAIASIAAATPHLGFWGALTIHGGELATTGVVATETAVATVTGANIPSSLPLPAPGPAVLHAEAEVASLAAQERAAMQAFDDVPLPTVPNSPGIMPTGPPGLSVVVEGKGLASPLVPFNAKPPALAGSAANHIYAETRPLDKEFPGLVGVNPHYVPGAPPGTNTNCVSCANAGQARLTGANPAAVAEPSRGYAHPNELLPSAPFGFGQATTVASVKADLLQAGDGAVGVVRVLQGGNIEHVINATNRGGIVYFLDVQSGHIVELNPNVQVRLGTP